MRNGRFGRLLAGSLLAVTAMAPMPGHAAPDRVLPAVPMPPAASAPQPAATEPGLRGSLDQFVPGNDVPVAERLRTIISSKDIHRRIDWAPYRKEVERFYAARHYAPVWVHDGALTARGKAVIARLRNATADGLDRADYPVPNFGSDPKCWPRTTSKSPSRCSTSPVIWRSAASRRGASCRRSNTATTRLIRPAF